MLLSEQLGRTLLAELIPADWADFTPMIVEGLHHFVERLPAHRRAEIANQQAALPFDAGVSERLVALFRCCPTLHKLGQVVARDQRLPYELRSRLQELEVMQPRTSRAELCQIIHQELGELSRMGVTCHENALAEGSVAVVLPFEWGGADSDESVSGVFKILKPGVEQRLAEDLVAWNELGGFLEDELGRRGIGSMPIRDMLNDVSELLSNEVRLDVEQENMRIAADQFAGDREVVIPRLLPFCTPRITAMERLVGMPWASCHGLGESQRRRIADIVVRCCLATPMWTTRETSLFHGDPHAGNFVVLKDLGGGDVRLGLIDWALAGRFSRVLRIALTDLGLAVEMGDCSGVVRSLGQLGAKIADVTALRATIGAVFSKSRPCNLPEFSNTVLLLDTVAQHASVQLPASLLVIRKSLLTLRGLVQHILPHFNLDEAMLGHGISQLYADWPGRCFAMPWDRGAYSHVSSVDLWRLAVSRSWSMAAIPFASAVN